MAHAAGFKARHAVFAFGLTIFGMVAQFLVRVAMTDRLGAGREYDAFLVAQIPASLIAVVGFQAMASALVPRLADLIISGNGHVARRAFDRILMVCVAFWSLVGLCVCVWAFAVSGQETRYGAGFGKVAIAVVVGWGLLAGIATLQRQLLVYFGRIVLPSLATMLPAVFLIGAGYVVGQPTVRTFVLAGLAGQVAGTSAMALQLFLEWRRHVPADAPRAHAGEIPADMTFVRLSVVSLPIFLASLNAQACGVIDQSLAAWWQVGGLTMLSAALAVARLPQTVADSVTGAAGYGMMCNAAAAVKASQDDAVARQRMAAAFRTLIRLQAMFVLPAAAFVLVSHGPIIEFLYQRGKFGEAEALMTAHILAFYPLCAVGQSLQSVQVSMLVTLGRAAVALRYEIILTVLSAGLDVAFLFMFGLPGIVASTGVAVTVVGLMIYFAIVRLGVGIELRDLGDTLRRPLLAAAAAVVAAWLADLAAQHLAGGGALLRILASGVVAGGVYYGLANGRDILNMVTRASRPSGSESA